MAHVPVLAIEVAELLDLHPGDTVVDCTFGAGGHAALLEPRLRGQGSYIAIDRDPEAREHFDAFAATAAPTPASSAATSRWCCATLPPPACARTRS